MDFTFELACGLGYFRENNSSVHYFDDPLLEQLSLGVMQGLGRKARAAFCSDTSGFRCTAAFSTLDLCVW